MSTKRNWSTLTKVSLFLAFAVVATIGFAFISNDDRALAAAPDYPTCSAVWDRAQDYVSQGELEKVCALNTSVSFGALSGQYALAMENHARSEGLGLTFAGNADRALAPVFDYPRACTAIWDRAQEYVSQDVLESVCAFNAPASFDPLSWKYALEMENQAMNETFGWTLGR